MKEIKAVIRPNKLPALRSALMAVPGFPGMTVLKGEGCSAPARTHFRSATIADELTDYTPKAYVIMVAPDDMVDALMTCIEKVCTTGHQGDGIAWVMEVEHALFLFNGASDPG